MATGVSRTSTTPSRQRTNLGCREEAWPAAALEFLADVAAQTFGIGGGPAPLGGDELGAVGLHDQAAQIDRVTGFVDGMTRDRRAARPIEHRQHCMLGTNAGRGRNMIDGGKPFMQLMVV